jgi:hypothetical protein
MNDIKRAGHRAHHIYTHTHFSHISYLCVCVCVCVYVPSLIWLGPEKIAEGRISPNISTAVTEISTAT